MELGCRWVSCHGLLNCSGLGRRNNFAEKEAKYPQQPLSADLEFRRYLAPTLCKAVVENHDSRQSCAIRSRAGKLANIFSCVIFSCAAFDRIANRFNQDAWQIFPSSSMVLPQFLV